MSIDDFGSGFTSLAYLGSLPITELKLDRTFISGLSASGREQDIKLVRATIELGHALGLLVVAEGIETLATLELLALLGCDRAQGYFTGRPVPALEFEAGSNPSDPAGGAGQSASRLPQPTSAPPSDPRSPLGDRVCTSTAVTRARRTDQRASDLCAAAEEPRALL